MNMNMNMNKNSNTQGLHQGHLRAAEAALA